MESGKESLRSSGEGFPPMLDHVCGVGFFGDPAAQATLAPLMAALTNPALSALLSTFVYGITPALPFGKAGIELTAATVMAAQRATCIENTVEVSKKCLWSTVMHHRSDSTTCTPW